MPRISLAILFVWIALPVWAECLGRDVLADMPDADLVALKEQSAAHPYPNGILWQATRGEQIIDIVGTMHAYDIRHFDTFEQVIPLVDQADVVFLELGEGDEARMQRKITENPEIAFIMDGPTLPDLLAPQDWSRLRDAMADRGVPGFMAAKMQPWMALISLSLTKCMMEDLQSGRKGLDHLIIGYATEIGNPARALEPYDTALTLFEDFSTDEILQFLSLTLRMETTTPEDQHKTLVESYFREEIRVIWELSLMQGLADPQGQDPAQIRREFERFEELLLAQRNRQWMERILPAAEQGRVFVAAGALHLPGKAGVLKLLENEGFTIIRVARN